MKITTRNDRRSDRERTKHTTSDSVPGSSTSVPEKKKKEKEKMKEEGGKKKKEKKELLPLHRPEQ